MPYYAGLRRETDAVRKRVAEGLVRLRRTIVDSGVPPKTLDGDVLIASWNIREFDSAKYGGRLVDAFHYIAEIISHFDLVAVQEVRSDLSALDRVIGLLGGWWKYVVTDVTEGTSGKVLTDRKGSNIAKDKYYDQIAIWRGRRFDATDRGGVLDYYDAVYRAEDEGGYAGEIKPGKLPKFSDWKTYQMSDHLVLWAAFKVDFADDYIAQLAEGEKQTRSEVEVSSSCLMSLTNASSDLTPINHARRWDGR